MMTSAHSPPDDTADTDSQSQHIHLLMPAGENRRLLAEALGTAYTVTESTTPPGSTPAFDLCLVDETTFERHREAIETYKRQDEVFRPVLLLRTAGADIPLAPSVWETIDEVITAPIRKETLRARLSNLLERRATSAQLAKRERALASTVSELEVIQRAIDAAPVGVTITDPQQPDNPTVYANAAFERITGYDRDEILGRNMRFLQGPATDEAAVASMREAVDDEEPVSVTLTNYRADGTQFWNRVDIAPVRDESGTVTNFVGFQTDVTEETVREQRLSVLNRLMRHNLSNDLNVVDGYVDILLESIDDPDHVEALEEIKTAAAKLNTLGQDVRRIERLLTSCQSLSRPIEVGDALADVRDEIADSYPDADIRLTVEDGTWHVNGLGLRAVFTELVENAVVHNERGTATVDIEVSPAEGGSCTEVRVRDDGPGIPGSMIDMLHAGEETPLKHGDRLGLWLVYWVVTLVGGSVEFETPDDGGTVVTITLPVTEADPG